LRTTSPRPSSASRSPFARHGRGTSATNDSAIDARRLLRQEAGIYEHLAGSGVPVPQVLACDTTHEPDLLLTSFVEHDGTSPQRVEAQRVLADLHAVAPAGLPR
jgi:aminoglycoside phosphotransferase